MASIDLADCEGAPSSIHHTSGPRDLFRQWLELNRAVAWRGRPPSNARRRRASIFLRAIRTRAADADEVMCKLALWRCAKAEDATRAKRRPSDALLRSALDDLSALR